MAQERDPLSKANTVRLEYLSKCKQNFKLIITVSFVYTFPHIGISRSKLDFKNAF